jgi:hypothetical protein
LRTTSGLCSKSPQIECIRIHSLRLHLYTNTSEPWSLLRKAHYISKVNVVNICFLLFFHPTQAESGSPLTFRYPEYNSIVYNYLNVIGCPQLESSPLI